MKRIFWISLLAVIAFALILLVRLPASWLSGFLPAQIVCGEISGTAWNGTCSGLVARGAALGDLTWQWRAAGLATAKFSGHLSIEGPSGSANADVVASRDGNVEARDVQADFLLDPTLIPHIPSDLRGRMEARLNSLSLKNGVITAVEGRIDAHDLVKKSSSQPNWGDYSLTFPSRRATAHSAEPVGDLDSVRGLWKVAASLRLTPEPGFELEGLIAPGDGAPADVLRDLQNLGPADAQGWRPFSVSGTF